MGSGNSKAEAPPSHQAPTSQPQQSTPEDAQAEDNVAPLPQMSKKSFRKERRGNNDACCVEMSVAPAFDKGKKEQRKARGNSAGTAGELSAGVSHIAEHVQEILVSALSKNNLFVSMDRGELDKILSVMVQCSFQRGDEVIKQGQRGKYFYVIENGDFQVRIKKADGEMITKIMAPGTGFGDLFVLNVPASATVITHTDNSTLWRLSRNLFRKVLRQAEEDKLKKKMDILETMDVFSSMTRHELVTLADSLEPKVFQDKDIIFAQGAVGDCCYILMQGSVVLTQTSELPVARNDVSTGKSTIIEMDDEDGGEDDGEGEMERNAEGTNEFVQSMADREGAPSDILSPDGDEGSRIVSASAKRVTKAGKRWRNSFKEAHVLKKMQAPDYFGERALLTKEGRIANAIAEGEVKCLCISEYKFRQLLGPLQEITHRTKNEYSALVLRRLPMFRNTLGGKNKGGDKKDLVRTLTPGEFIVGDKVMGFGEKWNRFYIIWKGEVAALTSAQMAMSDEELKGNAPTNYYRGDYFGYEECMMNAAFLQKEHEGKSEEEIKLFNDELDPELLQRSSATFIARDNTTIMSVDGKTFLNELNKMGISSEEWRTETVAVPAKAPEIAPTKNDKRKDSVLQLKPVPRKYSVLKTLTLRTTKAYEFLCPQKDGLLGKGAFGHVFVVYHPHTGKVYAMKRLAATNIAQHGGKQFVPLLHRERDLMAAIPQHPFIVNLHGTCKDAENLYLVMDYVNGTPLGNYCENKWNKGRNLTSKEVKYFSMCMLEALGHLHQNDIMYRDLKLENVVIDYQSGLLKLIDFGLSKQLNKVKTWTVCGTPLYIAPEVISCTGYRFTADWWMFGVVLFELVYAITPFDGEDQFEIFKNILRCDVQFPSDPDPGDLFKNMSKKLLCPDPTQRSGAYQIIRGHPWFDFEMHNLFGEGKLPFVKEAKDIDFEGATAIVTKAECEKEPTLNWFYDVWLNWD